MYTTPLFFLENVACFHWRKFAVYMSILSVEKTVPYIVVIYGPIDNPCVNSL